MSTENHHEVGVEEARKSLGDLVSRVAYAGDRYVITRHGRPMAALVPVTDQDNTTTEDDMGNSPLTTRRAALRREGKSAVEAERQLGREVDHAAQTGKSAGEMWDANGNRKS